MGRPRRLYHQFRITVDVDRETWQRLSSISKSEQLPLAKVIRALIAGFLSGPEKRLALEPPSIKRRGRT